jgi:hypothetical protein
MALEEFSKSEKGICRQAFDKAYMREYESVCENVKKMVAAAKEKNEIWAVGDYLYDKRREIDQKYDYRFSRLLSVFGLLYFEKWLDINDLKGMAQEKIDLIKQYATSYKE